MPVPHCLIAIIGAALTVLLLWNVNPFLALGVAPLTGSAAVLAIEAARLALAQAFGAAHQMSSPAVMSEPLH